ncbi:MAG: hypothetical protein FWC73_04520 [Defluviitaleaceae bacterium]|nr:hypothetical protein [Defluviitaleaceae bacterium]
MIKWSKRVPQALIAKLYNQSVSGIADDELADEVGCALFARCESIISATYGFEEKRMICLYCGKDIPLVDQCFTCPCGFSATWETFRKSYKGKQLHASNALPVFLAFHKNFPKAKTYSEKLICIDILIHSFHVKMSYYRDLEDTDPANENVALNRPTAANLIEGSLKEVILFLDDLSAIEEYSHGKRHWRSIIERANGGEVLAKRVV